MGRRLSVALEAVTGAQVTLFARPEPVLEHLAQQRCDVAVAAGDLADSACPALLRQVQLRHPEVVRVVVTDRDAADVFRRVPYAHQFFERSAAPDALARALA